MSTATKYKVIGGFTKSCGCRRFKKGADAIQYSHGHATNGKLSPTYYSWRCMKDRCRPTHRQSKDYFKRGITVCERWQKSFANFLADMGERPDGMSIDRIDNDKGYYPENCRWATQREQVLNSRTAKFIDGLCIKDFAKSIGVNRMTVSKKLKAGLTASEIAADSRERLLTIDYVTMSVTEWTSHPEANRRETIYTRLRRGKSHKSAVFGD